MTFASMPSELKVKIFEFVVKKGDWLDEDEWEDVDEWGWLTEDEDEWETEDEDEDTDEKYDDIFFDEVYLL